MEIDEAEYVLDLEPGGETTVYFNFETMECSDIPECRVVVVIDPENEIEEYYEDNNIMSRVITLGE